MPQIRVGTAEAHLGALVEPLAVGLHAVRNSGVRIGESAVVFGAGPIGLATITMLRAAGVTRVITSWWQRPASSSPSRPAPRT
jgi:(R,R)-butanediol dehydrogenase/meso-butanediol dehydrogenase/diacetyl reductase